MAILSIPLGIIALILLVWSLNGIGKKSDNGKKKDNDSYIIGIIAGLLLFFVSLGIYDEKESTGGLMSSEQSNQEQSARSERTASKNQAQHEIEEAEAKRKNENNKSIDEESSNSENVSKVREDNKNQNLEKQREAYQNWHNQIEARIQSIDTIWSALWTDGSPESINKLLKSLETEKSQLEAIKVPTELSAFHNQKLSAAQKRYVEWIDSRLQACQLYTRNANQQDITNELANGDGLKMRSNVEVSNVGRELGLSD